MHLSKNIVTISIIVLFTISFIPTSQEAVAQTSNLLPQDSNPGFENWINASYPAGYYSFPPQFIIFRSTNAHSGSYSLQIDSSSFGSFGLNRSHVNVSPLTWYSFSFWYYMPSSDTGFISFHVQLLDNNSHYISSAQSNYGFSRNSWALNTVNFLTTKDTSRLTFTIDISVSSSTEEFYFDDFQLTYSSQSSTSVIGINSNSPNSLNPILVILLVIGLLVLLYYFIRKSNNSLNGISQTHNSQSPVNPMNQYWFCPFDRTPLQIEVNGDTSNQYFTLERNNISLNLQNAIAMKKLPPEAYPQAEQLAMHLFNLTGATELTFVSTRCRYCNRILSAPQLPSYTGSN